MSEVFLGKSLVQYRVDRAAMKQYLLGRGYKTALRVLSFAESHHTGTRKDGVTPEFQHQLRIAFSILNLRDVANEELCLCLAFLHDTPEDYGVSYAVLEEKFGAEIAKKACILDKGQHATDDAYFEAIENDIDCSIVKGADNGDNIQSMVGVFNEAKIRTYMVRTKTQILPMLKRAANNFPEQHFAYASLRMRLKDQMLIYTHYVAEVTND
jgi:(p)ppGpp synthase/HD superfamily hydrolase